MSKEGKGMMDSINEMARNLGIGKVTATDEGMVVSDLVEEVKVNLGEFKPKRKFLNFISGVNGARVRFIRDIAFLKGDKLSGMLEGVIFKITICDEGTIDFEEVDTNISDKAMRQRLIDDIDSNDVTGYTQKFIVANLEFNDIDGLRCYLEVDNLKPIDKFRSLFAEPERLSDKGMDFLDSLFGDSLDEESEVSDLEVEDEQERSITTVDDKETTTKTHLEEVFKKMNEDKIVELKSRIEDSEKDIRKYNNEIKQTEARVSEVNSKLSILQSRLDSLSPIDEPNGYVFFVSEEQKVETGIDDSTKSIADKIADLMGLKKDVLFEHLTSSFYKIKVAKKDDLKDFTLSDEISEKILSIDVLGKFTMNTNSSKENIFEYRGDLTWHQLVGKFLRKGFEQDPQFDRESGSNSYIREKDLSGEMNNLKESLDIHLSQGNSNVVDLSGPEYRTPEYEEESAVQEFDRDYNGCKDLKTFDKETNLVIVGTMVDDDCDLQITDDYTAYDVYIGNKIQKLNAESDGFLTIMELDEYKSWLASQTDNGEDTFNAIDCLFLSNFKGTIGVFVKTEDGDFSTDFDLSDYIAHQFEDSVEVSLILPEGTTVIQMEDGKLPDDVIRDLKIDEIMK